MTPRKKAKEIINDFRDIVLTDYRYDEEPIFRFQQMAALHSM